MSNEDVAQAAKNNGTTRATACIDKAAQLEKPVIFAVGNAPTALIRLYELIQDKKIKPELIIGVPVGFVNVVQSKELIMEQMCRILLHAEEKAEAILQHVSVMHCYI